MKQILSSWVVLFLIVSAVAQTTTTATPRRKAASQSVAAELQEFREALAAQQKQIETLQQSPGIHRVVLRYGFMESPNIPRALEDLNARGVVFDPMQASYFLGREVLVPAMVPKMPWWRLWLFLVLARNAVPATEFFRIPSDRVVELGVRVAI